MTNRSPTDNAQSTGNKEPILSSLHKEEALYDLVREYVLSISEKIAEMQGFQDHDRYTDLARMASRIKCSLANYGFPEVSIRMGNIEQSAIELNGDEIAKNLAELAIEAVRMLSGVNEKPA